MSLIGARRAGTPSIEHSAGIGWSTAFAYPIAAGAGFVILLLEITAGRLLAPAVGVSLETWTGIIGIVLAGYAFGDAVGGALADRYPSPRLPAIVLLLAGMAVLAAAPLADLFAGILLAAPLFVRVILLSALVLLVPSTLLGAILPIVTRLTLRATGAAGRTAGGLSAASTASSVLGVILGGFVVLEHFGVHAILRASGVALAALAAVPLLAGPTQARRQEIALPTEAPDRPSTHYAVPAPLLFAALAGASIMVVELAAARVIGPLFGNSLYTWGSVIGATLLGISLGNALGGLLADRRPLPSLLAAAMALSGAAVFAVLLLPYVYSRVWSGLPRALFAALPAAVTLPLLIGAMLLPAAVGFGTISPILIRLSLRSVGRSGNLVGRVYAAQAIGSIAGTFAAGFVLISWLGARAAVLLVAEGAVLLGVLLAGIGTDRPPRPLLRAAAAAAFAVTLLAAATGRVPSPCLRESNYYCIRVLDVGPHTRALALDGLIHSYVDLQDPAHMEYDHEQGWAALVEDLAAEGHVAPRALFIGGGGYVFPRYLQRRLPQSRIEVVEIDPAVTQTAQAELGLSPDMPWRIVHEDGRQFFLGGARHEYDLIFTDVFRDAYSIPYHLTTLEFARHVAGALNNDGVYAVNIVDGRPGLFVRSFVRTLQQVFRHVYLLPAGADWRQNVQTIFVVFASQDPLDLTRITARRPRGVPSLTLVPLSNEDLATYLAAGPSIVLTDDRAPVEQFLARVYAEVVRDR